MSGKIVDARYVEHERTAVLLARLCYPIGVAIEEAQPATALKLLEAGYAARFELGELASPLLLKSPERKKKRALAAVKCVRVILTRLQRDHTAQAERIGAVIAVADGLIELIQSDR